ncbi:LacI family DNA-binding transcriptional regulator [uncultured Sphaerochaeta sp.]|uniref:LacI family DNA-binding transcriptional regulator n=1 Tax=uncultured Sphaerochaeta sp. TaxID=886478 RepID=UPI002A0A6141|nr:LacI family DNA-binding transcriptional regulator [uncultured Sphaerochaeta sp.]
MAESATSLKEVALKAGVSISTVSRVLSGTDYVHEKTRSRVLAVVRELNYRPNMMARSLKLGKTNAIALMIPSIDNMIFPPIVRGVEDIARAQDYVVTLCNTDDNPDTEARYIQKLCNMGVDGIIDATLRKESQRITDLRDEGFPVVLTSRNYDNSLDAIVIDNYASAYEMTSFLISRGYRHIAFAMGDAQLLLYANRLSGYTQALLDHGLPFDKELVMYELDNPNSFYPLVKDLVKRIPSVDAVFASNDLRAIIIMRALRDLGLHIPQDIGVVGFDDIPISTFMDPPLTTIHQPLYEIGVQAAKRLIQQIQNKTEKGILDSPRIEILETKLTVRDSTK